MGRFLPHPNDVPVELTPRNQPRIPPQRLHTIGLGGVACNCPRAWRRGTAVLMHMPGIGPDARYPGYVAWCRKIEDGYRIGITFTDEQALFGARMGEQVCQIEHYCRLNPSPEGMPTDIETLAREWVEQHAHEFSFEAISAANPLPALD